MSRVSRAVVRTIVEPIAVAAASAALIYVAPPTPAFAQGPTEAPPLYQVEVIVFAYNDADPNEELFRPQAGAAAQQRPGPDLDAFDFEPLTAPDLADRIATPPGRGDEPGGPEAAPGGVQADPGGALADGDPGTGLAAGGSAGRDADAPFRFRIVERDALRMRSAYDRLQRIDAYTPLLHGAWIQEALPENAAQPFDLAYLGTFNPLGTIRLHVSRFLHLTLDLDYRPTPLQPVAAGPPPAGPPAFTPLSELSLRPRLRLETGRRIRSGEINYFDHPYFGVLVMVTPYEPEQERDAAEGPAA